MSLRAVALLAAALLGLACACDRAEPLARFEGRADAGAPQASTDDAGGPPSPVRIGSVPLGGPVPPRNATGPFSMPVKTTVVQGDAGPAGDGAPSGPKSIPGDVAGAVARTAGGHCEKSYAALSVLARRASKAAPSRDDYLRICGLFPEEMQKCLQPEWQTNHQELCRDVAVTVDRSVLEAFERLLLDQP